MCRLLLVFSIRPASVIPPQFPPPQTLLHIKLPISLPLILLDSLIANAWTAFAKPVGVQISPHKPLSTSNSKYLLFICTIFDIIRARRPREMSRQAQHAEACYWGPMENEENCLKLGCSAWMENLARGKGYLCERALYLYIYTHIIRSTCWLRLHSIHLQMEFTLKYEFICTHKHA